MNDAAVRAHAAKVPAATLVFWLVKIAATTLGETGGDAVSMSLGLGYLRSTLIFAVLFLAVVAVQVHARTFRAPLYWATIIASTTVGTTLADFADRSIGLGYAGGSLLLLTALVVSLALWRRSLGTIAIASVVTPAAEGFYWLTITCSQTLGTALGDWVADAPDMGYGRATLLFGSLLALVVLLAFATRLSRTVLFWTAFVLTRPLGAVVGDLMDKPLDHGGFGLSRFVASGVLLGFIVLCLVLWPTRAASATPASAAGEPGRVT